MPAPKPLLLALPSPSDRRLDEMKLATARLEPVARELARTARTLGGMRAVHRFLEKEARDWQATATPESRALRELVTRHAELKAKWIRARDRFRCAALLEVLERIAIRDREQGLLATYSPQAPYRARLASA